MSQSNDNTIPAEFLAKYRIRSITPVNEPGTIPVTVESESGSRYTVDRNAFIDRYDGGMEFRWSCTCPARKRCRHIDAVEDWLYAQALADQDYDALEIIERTV